MKIGKKGFFANLFFNHICGNLTAKLPKLDQERAFSFGGSSVKHLKWAFMFCIVFFIFIFFHCRSLKLFQSESCGEKTWAKLSAFFKNKFRFHAGTGVFFFFFSHFDNEIEKKMTSVWSFGAFKMYLCNPFQPVAVTWSAPPPSPPAAALPPRPAPSFWVQTKPALTLRHSSLKIINRPTFRRHLCCSLFISWCWIIKLQDQKILIVLYMNAEYFQKIFLLKSILRKMFYLGYFLSSQNYVTFLIWSFVCNFNWLINVILKCVKLT